MPSPAPPYLRSTELLSRCDCRLLIVDMQQKLLPAIRRGQQVTANCIKLVRAARLLGPPVFATEQYPRGLGPTVPELAELLAERSEKRRFSCSESLAWGTAGDSMDSALQDRTKVVLAGIEAHVCVLQTALDLMADGYRIYVAADAVGSRRRLDRQIALQRMADSGAVITTTESVLFEWCEQAGSDEFKEISRLVKER
jgi:nicotinamidase-related amidase